MMTEEHPYGWPKIIKKAKYLLNSGYYTLTKLTNYLRRLDMYQAISLYDAIQILTDYVRMCKQCDVEPDTETNSLKREHDVLARNFWSLKRDASDEKYVEVAEKHKYLEYEDKEFFVAVPKSVQDIISEGAAQRNCVGSYIDRVVKGDTIITFLRKKSEPEKSFITIEISPITHQIRQKAMRMNCPVTSKKTLAFIEKWQKNILAPMAKPIARATA